MATPLFNVTRLEAPDRLIGAYSDPVPCSAGDRITFTASIRAVSGVMRPMIAVDFWDGTLSNYLGSLQVCPPNTDEGWHNYTASVTAPAGAALMVVQTYCSYIPAFGTSYFVGFTTN